MQALKKLRTVEKPYHLNVPRALEEPSSSDRGSLGTNSKLGLKIWVG